MIDNIIMAQHSVGSLALAAHHAMTHAVGTAVTTKDKVTVVDDFKTTEPIPYQLHDYYTSTHTYPVEYVPSSPDKGKRYSIPKYRPGTNQRKLRKRNKW